MLDVCSSWAAAIQAALWLWPTATLALPPTELNELELRQGNFPASWAMHASISTANDDVFDAAAADQAAAMDLLKKAAQISPCCLRVLVQGDERTKVSRAHPVQWWQWHGRSW